MGPVATGTGFFTPEPSAGPRKLQLGGKGDKRVLKMELPTGSVYVPPPIVSHQPPQPFQCSNGFVILGAG